MTLRINIVTIFPEFFAGPLGLSIPARAAAAGSVRYNVVDLREFTHDRHRTVDDYAYGGGPGMVMKPQPFFEAVDSLGAKPPVVLVSARGRSFTHADAMRFSEGEELTILCGHYKDVDQRVADHLATEELSLGDFIVSGGEPVALAIVDATVRLLPGAMSDLDSARTDSFFGGEGGLSAPSYTRPPSYRGHEVPGVLLSGDHARIAKWRESRGRDLDREREIIIRPATRDDLESARRLAERCGLPIDGIDEAFPAGYAVAQNPEGSIVGLAGVERYADGGLLRSVAVDEPARRSGLGERLVADRLRWAARAGLRTVYLLTTMAADYFARRGFDRVSREAIPESVRASREFSELCPSSAVAMVRSVASANPEQAE